MSELNKFVIELDENKTGYSHYFLIKSLSSGSLINLYYDDKGEDIRLQGYEENKVSSKTVFYAKDKKVSLSIFNETCILYREPEFIDKRDLISAINTASNNGKHIDARVLVEMLEGL